MDNYRRKDARTMESEILRLIAAGKTYDALSLYQSIWTYDDMTDNERALNNNNNNNNNNSNNSRQSRQRQQPCCKPTTRLMNHAIHACAKCPSGPMLDRAFEILQFAIKGGTRGVRRLSPNVYTFGALVKVCARAGDADRCVALIEQMRNEFKVQPNAVIYSTAISACERSHPPRPDMAVRLLQQCVNPITDTDQSTDNNTISKNKTAKNTAAANTLTMMDGTMNIVGYNAALSACARGGRWKMALRLLDEMNQNSCHSNQDGYVANLHLDDIDFNDDELQITGDDVITHDSRILDPDAVSPTPDSVTYGTVMAACERSGQWEQVLALARIMENLEWVSRNRMHTDEPTLNGTAATVRKKATNTNTYNNDENSLVTIRMDGMALTSAVHACQQLGLGHDAIRYLNKMKQLATSDQPRQPPPQQQQQQPQQPQQRPTKRKPLHGPDDVAYRLAISACARASQWKQGIRLLREMQFFTGQAPDVVAYTSAISGCATAGEYRKAMELMEEMQSDECGALQPNVVTYSTVIRACAAACMKAVARRREMESYGDVNGAWDAGTDWTTGVDNDGLEYGDDGSGMLYSSSNLALSVEEPLQAALSLLEQMTQNDTVVDPNIVTYNAAILACAEGLDIDKAFELWHNLKKRGLKPTEVTYGSLMLACERTGSVKGVTRIFRAMQEQSQSDDDTASTSDNIQPNEIIYGTAISCFRKAGQPERTIALFRKMINDGLTPNVATFNTVLMALTENSRALDLDKAIVVYKILRSTNHVPDTTQPSQQTYNILIRAMALHGRPDEAEFFLGEMATNGFIPDVDLFTLTVASYERNREPLKALKLMESMRRDGYDFYEIKVLDSAFKRVVKLANVVGTTLSTTNNNRNDNGGGQQQENSIVEDAMLLLENQDVTTNGISFEKSNFATEG